MVRVVGRHQSPRTRRKSATVLAALAAPAVVFLAAGADAYPGAAPEVAAPVAADVAPGCFEVVAAMPAPGVPGDGAGRSAEFAAASRWHRQSRFLPVGVASERGLQVRTILVARAISATFPEIHEIGGVRPDPLPWHPNGLAIDVMIPNAGTAQGIALGNRIDHQVIIPDYIMEAIHFLCPILSTEVWFHILNFRVACIEKSGLSMPGVIQGARNALAFFRSGELDLAAIKALMLVNFTSDPINRILDKAG